MLRSVASRFLLSVPLSLCLVLSAGSLPAQEGVRINEILAVNSSGLADSDGDVSDWIELHNPGGQPASLGGYTLTNDPEQPDLWAFPSNASIPAGGYLVVYASGKDRSTLFSPGHTSFTLSRGGGFVGLFGPDGSMIDAMDYPRQYGDISFDGENYMTNPSPAAPNQAGLEGPEAEVVLSVSSGLFTGTLTVELSAPGAAEGSKIHYSTGKSVVKASLFNVYTRPLVLAESAHVTAVVVEPGRIPSPTAAAAYLRVSPEVLDFTSDLPIVLLDNQNGRTPSEQDPGFATWMLFEPDPETGRTSLRAAPSMVSRSGIRRRGSSTAGNPKYALAVETWRDDADTDAEIAPLGLPADADWVLNPPYTFDRALVRNPFVFELSRMMGSYAPRSRFVEVFMNTDGDELGDGDYLRAASGDYFGVYSLMEKIKRGPDRVNVEEAVAGHTSGLGLTGGYMLRVDRVSKGDPEQPFNAGGQGDLVWNYPKQEDLVPHQDAYMKGFLNDMAAAMRSDDAENPETGYRAYIDTRSWIVEHMIRLLTKDPDGLRLSTYLYKPRGGKLHYGPVWDFDRTMGCDSDARALSPLDWNPSSGVDYLTYTWFSNLIGSAVRTGGPAKRPDFWQEWIDMWSLFRSGPLSEEGMNALIDSLASEVVEAQPRDTVRWPAAAPNGGNGNGASDYDDGIPGWPGEVQHLKGWLRERVRWIDKQFVTPPVIEPAGGIVEAGTSVRVRAPDTSLFNPVSVHYSVDGSDPRALGGATHPDAATAAAQLTIDATGSYLFRCRDDAEWSAPVRIHYAVGAIPASRGDLIVSELMYHPAAPAPEELERGYGDDGYFEYVELFNPGPEPVYLGDLAFTEGIRFDFAEGNRAALGPGERAVLASHPEAFAFRYGGDVPVLGRFEGSLDNGGETLTLTAVREGEAAEVLTLRYNDRDPWPAAADGLGYSLSLAALERGVDSSDPANWTVEGAPGGSPGLPPAVLLLSAFINEIVAAGSSPGAGAVELFNPYASDLDLEGWLLSDDEDDPGLWTFPAGTQIPAEGYLVIEEEGTFGNAFSLDPAVGVLLLSSPPGDDGSGVFQHRIDYDAAVEGDAIGRFLNSRGEERFALLERPTLGAANASPRIGPIILSELHYHPADSGPGSGMEFVELINTGPAAVPLHHPDDPETAWRIGGIDYTIPGNITLAPGEVLVVVRGDPEEFRSEHGLAESLRIAGPFEGRLDNAGERVRLRQPLSPERENVETPYATVDTVDYDDATPWPAAADGAGPALERVDAGLYGDDAAVWRASVPGGSPGSVPFELPGGLWEAWLSEHFSAEELADELLSGPGADPDGDEIANLGEHAFGTDPRSAAERPVIEAYRDEEGGVIGLSAPALPFGAVSAELQWSVDLSAWNVAEDAEWTPAAGGYLLRASAAEGSASVYVRMRLSME